MKVARRRFEALHAHGRRSSSLPTLLCTHQHLRIHELFLPPKWHHDIPRLSEGPVFTPSRAEHESIRASVLWRFLWDLKVEREASGFRISGFRT